MQMKIMEERGNKEGNMDKKLEPREGKIMFNAAGGKAGKNSVTTRTSIPKVWLDLMEITEENPSIKKSFINGKIIIEKL